MSVILAQIQKATEGVANKILTRRQKNLETTGLYNSSLLVAGKTQIITMIRVYAQKLRLRTINQPR